MNSLAKALNGRMHYGWIVAGIVFAMLLCSAGVRATPGVLIIPIEKALGWERTTVSSAVALNLVLFGLMGPFAGSAMLRFGIRRTVLTGLTLLVIGTASSTQITAPWQLLLTWGLIVGIGSGMCANVLAVTVANRWFTERRGLVSGLLSASTATGQLVFLPLLASVATQYGWRAVAWTVSCAVMLLIPLVAWLMVERPRDLGLRAYGAQQDDAPQAAATGNPAAFAISMLWQAAHVRDFWLLFATFFVCGLSTNGLIGTHFISFCYDGGMPELQAASILATMGLFNLVGTAFSGWLTDRFDCRKLLFWYYGLRGLSLMYLPFSDLSLVGIAVFSVFYGLDWVATVPPTMRLATNTFGRRNGPIVFGWIYVGHQCGSALAAGGGGLLRAEFGVYTGAFLISGIACIFASAGVLAIRRQRPHAEVPA